MGIEIGEEYDSETEFSYLNARYYQGSRGQFMSQDPAVEEAVRGQVRAFIERLLGV
jgi:RHS repeat-associated protein